MGSVFCILLNFFDDDAEFTGEYKKRLASKLISFSVDLSQIVSILGIAVLSLDCGI